jgi:hypothetical protein
MEVGYGKREGKEGKRGGWERKEGKEGKGGIGGIGMARKEGGDVNGRSGREERGWEGQVRW